MGNQGNNNHHQHQPWLDSLSDDWPSTPVSPKSPSSLTPGRSLQGSPTPSRIPVPARRVEQQSPQQSVVECRKKIIRPCHFIKHEPPTPKPYRSPKSPSKVRSPAPPKSKTNSPTPTPKPSPRAAPKQPMMDNRSPLRAVSNVSSQTAHQSTSTVQVKPKKGGQVREGTPEWRKRLVRGEIPAGEQQDLFAPMGLESVFKPPTPGSANAQQDSIPLAKQDDQLWGFTDATSRQDGSVKGTGDGAGDPKRIGGKHDTVENDMVSPLGTVNQAAWKRRSRQAHGAEDFSQANETQQRTASGLEDLRNEGITPITFSRTNTVEGNATSEVIKSALKQVTNKLENLSTETGSRPDSAASDSFIHYNESRPDSPPRDDSLLDVTSHSLPQDLSMGTMDFRRRGVLNRGSLRRRFSPSPFPSHRRSPANAKLRSSPLFNRSQADPPTLPRPSSSHVRPSASAGSPATKEPAMPSSGSPLKLFGQHDTFTNNRLLRRMSQFEETFGDLSDGDEPPSPSEEARRKGESRSLLNARQEPLSEISPRRNERLPSRSPTHDRISRFGDGELDGYDFSDTSPYEPKLVYDESRGFGSRPSSRKRSVRPQYLRRGSQQDRHRYSRTVSSGFTRKPTAWARQDFFDGLRDATRIEANKENHRFSETKRVPKAPAMDPTPKRRRTILRAKTAEPDPHPTGDSPSKHGDSLSLLQRSLLQHGLQFENGDRLAPPGLSHSLQRPRTPTPSQIRSAQDRIIPANRNFTETNFDERDYSDSFSLDGDVPLVKVTGTSDTSRKGSITTQDYLNEATKIMDFIRSKGRPAAGLTSVQESDGGSEDDDLSYEDESTREAFSRPPSRDGRDLRKLREPNQLNPQILSHLQKYQEKDDLEDGVGESVMSLHVRDKTRPGVDISKPGNEQRKRKQSGPVDDTAENIAQDLMTINTQISGFSLQSIPTGSSQSSQAKGILSSELLSHLIPEQVNGLTYDRSKHSWVKDGDEQLPPRASKSFEGADDPFRDIPDLSVDELQEMLRVHDSPSPAKERSPAQRQGNQARSPLVDRDSAKTRPRTTDGAPSTNGSTLQSKLSRFTSSVANSGTRATSWGSDPNRQPSGAVDPAQGHERSSTAAAPPAKQTRTATISFSSPLVSHVAYRDNSHVSESTDPTSHEKNANDGHAPHGQRPSVRSFVPPTGRQTSVGGQAFVRRPISRIEERNEDAGDDFSLVRRNDSPDVQHTPVTNGAGNFLMPLQSPGPDTSYSFQLSPLPDFSVNQVDNPLNLEMSYVAQRTHPSSLRQVHGTFALATEDLVKHITDVEPYEPYWEHVRRLVLRQKGLITLHKLSEFCPRLEDLDVSENDIGQLSGVPSSLRTLKIPRNCVSNLTAWGHLVNLQYLDVSGNDIETLDGFSSLIHLRELKANDNQIRNIDGILDLNGLLSLKLSNNCVTAVDFEGAELTRLRDLDLSHNCLTSVRNIHWLPSLTTLELSSNQIGQLDAASSLISLRALRLSSNRLDALDLTFFPSVNLLYVDQNHFSTISGLDKCHNLEVLSVREQTARTENHVGFALEIDLGLVKDVRKVFLSSNRLSSRSLSPSTPLLRLQLLDMAACTMQTLPDDFASSFPNLKVLNLNFNSVTEIEPLVGMNCLARLTMSGNRLSRMRRVCQVLSRLGRTVKGSECSLRKLDLRGNPLTVGFYPPPVTGKGTNTDKKKLKAQERAVVRQQQARRELSDALGDLGPNDEISHPVTWEDGIQPDREVEIDDPFTLPPADPHADEKYLIHLDKATRLRRRVLELLLYAGTSGSLHTLDGLELRPSLGEDCLDMNHAWAKLEHLGVLRRKAITN